MSLWLFIPSHFTLSKTRLLLIVLWWHQNVPKKSQTKHRSTGIFRKHNHNVNILLLLTAQLAFPPSANIYIFFNSDNLAVEDHHLLFASVAIHLAALRALPAPRLCICANVFYLPRYCLLHPLPFVSPLLYFIFGLTLFSAARSDVL